MIERPDYSQCVGDDAAVNEKFAECYDVKFIHKVFSAQPMLSTIEPDAFGNFYSIPFTGDEYDHEVYELADEGWDHEHCYVCYQAIQTGDEYWANVKSGISPDLCPFCYQELQSRLSTLPEGSDA